MALVAVPPWGSVLGAEAHDAGAACAVAASILLGVGWLSFVLLYAAFWSGGYSLFQSIVIVLVSLLVLAGVLGAMWATWGMRFAPFSRNLTIPPPHPVVVLAEENSGSPQS